MKRTIFGGLCVLTFLSPFDACRENERMEFGQKPSAYFSSSAAADGMAYSFASGKARQDTALIAAKIIGWSTGYDRKMAFDVDPSSTAQAGLQYEALRGMVTLPA